MKAYAQPLALWLIVVAALLLALVADGLLEELATLAAALPFLVIARSLVNDRRTLPRKIDQL